MIKIDKGIPMPESGAGRKRIYPFHELAVGDSFFAPNTTHANVNGPAQRARQQTGRKFALRKVTENGVDGVRVWRVE